MKVPSTIDFELVLGFTDVRKIENGYYKKVLIVFFTCCPYVESRKDTTVGSVALRWEDL